jgi:hypothetical protein
MIPQQVVSFYALKKKMTVDEASLVFKKLELFLGEAKTNPRSLNTSDEIDEAWHTLILHTKLYADYCKAEFGTFIHHFPSEQNCDPQGDG